MSFSVLFVAGLFETGSIYIGLAGLECTAVCVPLPLGLLLCATTLGILGPFLFRSEACEIAMGLPLLVLILSNGGFMFQFTAVRDG